MPSFCHAFTSLSSSEDAAHLRHDDRHLNIKRIVLGVKTTLCEMKGVRCSGRCLDHLLDQAWFSPI